MHKNQKGFAHLVAVVLVLLVVGISFVGYKVWEKESNKNTSTAASQVVAAKEQAAWKEAGIAVAGTYADADVIKISDTQWRLYYSIQPEVQGNRLEVYSSTSTDGKTWTQEAGTRKSMATFPDVIKLSDGRYRMYFQNAGLIKSAISSDGLTFTDESGTRIDKTNSENLTFDNVAAPTVAQLDDGTFVMVYRGTINTRYASNTPNPSTQVLMWATSTDGLTFTKKGLAVDSRSEVLNGQLDGPDLVKWDDGKFRLFATSYTGVYEFTFDGTKFGSPSLALAGEAKKTDMGFTGSPPGDPTTIKIGTVWFMYYGGPKEENGIHYANLK